MKAIQMLELADARHIAAAAEREAQANGWSVSIAVGVSGVKASEDAQIARAGIAALDGLLAAA